MKFKRILSVLLACLMLTGILTVGANAAWTDPEKKTQGDWAIPLVGKYLAWPGEMLITKLLLPRLLGGVLNGLLSGLSLDGLFNDDTLNGVLVSLGDGLEPLASSLSMNVGALIAKFAPDAPASLKAATTTLPTNTVWGADKTNFAAKLATALRPALVLGYVASVQQTDPSLDVAKQLADSYATGIAPALIALGIVPNAAEITAAYNAIKAAGDAFMASLAVPEVPAAMTTAACATADKLITETFGALLKALEGLIADPTALIFEKLPNLLYNARGLAGLSNLLGMLGFADAIDLSFLEDIGGSLEGLLAGLLGDIDLELDIAGLIEKLTFAGDLQANGIVKGDKSLVYNVLISFLYNSLKANKEAVIGLLKGLIPAELPDFLYTIMYYLVRIVVWFFRV